MKEEGKSYYEAPAITVVEVKIEGVVCHSPVNGGNSVEGAAGEGIVNSGAFWAFYSTLPNIPAKIDGKICGNLAVTFVVKWR